MSKQPIPQNLEAEEGLLGSIVIDEEQLSKIDVEASDFIEEGNQIIFKAMLDLYKEGSGVDNITLVHRLHREGTLDKVGGAARFSHLISIAPTSLHAPYFAKIIKECSLNRGLISVASKISQIGYENVDPVESLAKSQKLLTGISRLVPSTKIWTPQDMADYADKRYGQLRDTLPGIPTGMIAFDRKTGGLFNGDFVILGSRPGMGKTTFALQIAMQMSYYYKVLFVSLEMTPESVIDKLVAHLIKRPARLVRRGNYSEELLSQIALSLGDLASTNLYLSRGPATTNSIRQIIERMKLSYGLDAVFIDYLHYLRDRTGSNDNERIGFISGELANMAKEFNIPFVVLSQLSRATEGRLDKRPLLSDLRSSGSIEQDADLILFLSRKSYYDRDMNPHGVETELIIAKDRMRGEIGKLSFYWDNYRECYVNTPKEVSNVSEQQARLG